MADKTSPGRGKRRQTRSDRGVDLTIVRVELSKLHEDPANARRHGEKNLAAIRAALQEFGQVEPLIVMADTMRVIGGNGRLSVMRELGWSDCGVVLYRGSETEARALAIALNRTGELAEWNGDVLKQTLDAIAAEGFDVAKLGISDEDLSGIVQSALDGNKADSADGNKSSKHKKSSVSTTEDATGDQSDELPERWEVLVKCSTEDVQVELLSRLTEEGFECRALIS
jgi:ParB-like chromosome segregation protein Spo0J